MRVDLCSSTVVGVALADDIVVVLAGTSQVLAPTDVGRPSFPYSVPCSSCRLDIVPSGSSVAPRSWRLLLVVWILQRLLLFL